MFNLEEAIAEWRRQMAAGGMSDPEILDELESHLREAGAGTQSEFDERVRQIGQPKALKREFAKVGLDLKGAMLIFAGIPNRYVMNTTNVEPRWATYLKATAFLAPAIFLAIVSAVFVIPKLQQICLDAGLPESTAGGFWNLTHSSIVGILFLWHNSLLIAGALIALLILLEWRSGKWPRYRRATVGVGVFLLNSLILIAFFMMFLAAIVAAPGLRP